MVSGRFASLLLAAALATVPAGPPAAAQDLASFAVPAEGTAMPIGTYANGCLRGGVALPLEGEGYQAIRPERRVSSQPSRAAASRDGSG